MRHVAVFFVAVAALAAVWYVIAPPYAGEKGPSTPVEDPLSSQDVLAQPVPGGTLYEVMAGRSVGRYRVREELAGMSFPVDAVGVTDQVTGRIGFDASGAVVEGSRIHIHLASLTSDQTRRDNYVRENILHTQTYPYATFVLREVKGLEYPLPTEGTADITVIGDLTIRDVTRPVEWEGTAAFSGDTFSVAVRTAFPFAEFDLTPPRVALVLSVEDQIRLEAEIYLVRREA